MADTQREGGNKLALGQQHPKVTLLLQVRHLSSGVALASWKELRNWASDTRIDAGFVVSRHTDAWARGHVEPQRSANPSSRPSISH